MKLLIAALRVMIGNLKGIIIHLKKSKRYWIFTQASSIVMQFFAAYILAYSLESFYNGLSVKKHIIVFLIIYLLITYLFQFIMTYVESYFMMNLRTMIKNDLYTEMLKGINKSDKYVLDSSKVISEMSQNADIVSNIISTNITYFLASIVLLILFLSIIFYIDIIFGIAYLMVFLITTIIHILFYNKMSKYKSDAQKKTSISNSFISQSIAGISEIKIYRIQNKVISENEKLVDNIASSQFKYEKTYMKHELCTNLFYYFEQIFPVFLGIIILLFHSISVGKIMFLVQFTQYLLIYMMDFSESYCQIKSSQNIIEEVSKQLNITKEEKENLPYLKKGEYILELNNLHIEYDNNIVIKNINLKSKPGEIIAIVGESGAGKSSIFNAVMQFVDYQGTCLLCGYNVKAYSKESVRKNISYMDQNNSLLDISIYDNILIGNLEASRKEVIEASKNANALQFIESLPDGFDTVIGKEGMTLSGGEIQRICLVRAILRKSALILLDEPTSSLDIMNEIDVIKKILQNNMSSVILATHRVNILQKVDRIIVIQSGKIEAQGTVDELMSKSNYFKRMYNAQQIEE